MRSFSSERAGCLPAGSLNTVTCFRFAFTFVELLAAIAIVSVFLALALPVLGRSREQALSIKCLANERGIMQLFVAGANAHQDQWANAIVPRVDYFDYQSDQKIVTRLSGVLSQLRLWNGSLASQGLYSMASDHRAISCPTALSFFAQDIGDKMCFGPQKSYFYSAAFTTRAELWQSQLYQSAGDADRLRAAVRIADVLFPSRKVILSEQSSFHDRAGKANSFSLHDKMNLVFADGHGEFRSVAAASRAVPIVWGETATDRVPRGVEFSSPELGFRGRDY